tara:strand:- start:1370 stop:1585 length:216 start_codon:yes stop_codon:yes gene_type:complete
MSNKKQTAVEWLIDQLECFGNKHELTISWTTVDDLVERAKEMDKQQIIDAYETSHISMMTSEQYYNETYND